MLHSTQKMVALMIILLCCLCTSSARTPTKHGPTCYEMVIPVSINLKNASISSGFTLNAIPWLSTIPGYMFNTFVAGTYNIAARYCEPEVDVPSRANTLQLLVHGATYDRNYWSGHGPPGEGYNGTKYSWIDYASQRGYPTLSIDRLGSGLSSRPDPIATVKISTHVEIIHSLVPRLKGSGTGNPLPRAFSNVVYIGHSLGSIVGNLLTKKYPNDVEAMVLTGFSKSIIKAVPGLVTNMVLLPAAFVDRTMYGSLPVGYVVTTNKPGTMFVYFYQAPEPNGYDPAFADFDYRIRGTIAMGELITAGLSIGTAPAFTKPVMVITGQNDNIFCNPTGLQMTPGNCGGETGLLPKTGELYPAASNYTWVELANTGHCWQFHRNAAVGFAKVHDWLEGVGF